MLRTAISSTENAFLQAVLEHPDDDIPRLVFADWLEERGNPRGTFIRLQCRRAHWTHRDPEWSELLAQEAALLKQHEADWSVPIRGIADAYQFHRGFIDHVGLSASKFLKNAERLFRHAPIRGVHLKSVTSSEIDRFADCPLLARLNNLDLGFCGDGIGSRGVRGLVRSPFVRHLTRLVLNSCSLGPTGAEVLANTPMLASLRSLSVANNSLGEAGAGVLAASTRLEQLREVDFAGNELRADGAAALARTPTLRLTHLDLSRNNIGNQGAIALAASSAFGELRHLSLAENAISNLGIEAIAAAPHLSRLEHLNLENNRINDRGIHALAASTTLSELVYLNVHANEFGRAAAQKLANSPNFPKLRHLLGAAKGTS